MSATPSLKSQAAAWFNQTWILLEIRDRPLTETLDMLALAQASYTAWMSVPDHSAVHEAIGAWQVSRVHAVAGEGRLAEAWAHRSLAAAADPAVDPFYRSYAREALARAYRVQGRPTDVVAEVIRARLALEGTAEDELEALQTDLDALEAQPSTPRMVSLSVHRPRPGFADLVIGSMHRYGEAARTQPGLVEVQTLRSDEGEVLVGFAVWESASAKEAANATLRAAVEHDDFELWEEGVEGWGLSSI
jgi:heme-degrading monooxygenase HmoA